MAELKFKLIDGSDKPDSQKDEHIAMNAWLRDAAKGGQTLPESGPVDETGTGNPQQGLPENEGMNQALLKMAGSKGYLR